MAKKSSRKHQMPDEMFLTPAVPIEPMPLPVLPQPSKNGFVTFIHLVFSLVIIWLIGRTLWEFKSYWETRTPVSGIQNASVNKNETASSSPASVTAKAPVNESEPSTPRMNITLEFDGIKSKWGYSGWSTDGSANPNVNKSIQGTDLKIRDVTYKQGIGTHAPSEIVFGLNGKVKRFTCLVGPDNSGGGSDYIVFKVYGDGNKLFESPGMKGVLKPLPVDLNVSGVKNLSLKVVTVLTGDGWGHADWLNLKFVKE